MFDDHEQLKFNHHTKTTKSDHKASSVARCEVYAVPKKPAGKGHAGGIKRAKKIE